MISSQGSGRRQLVTGLLLTGALVFVVNSAPEARRAPTQTPAGATPHAPHALARQLVQKASAAHPETDEIGMSVQGPGGCTVIASTDASDVGETCEEDDAAPIKTGEPSVGKEGGEFDVSVPLHDQAGRPVGALTARFKQAAGQTNAGVTQQATAIAAEMASQIPSKAALLSR